MDRYRKQRFSRNLKALLEARCVTRKEAAAGAQVPYQWLRRAVSEGISRPDKRNKGHLAALVRYFELTSVERLWDRNLYVPPPPSSIKDVADQLGELMREFVLVVGAEDALLREVRKQIEPIVSDHRWREKKLKEEQERTKRIAELKASLTAPIEGTSDRDAQVDWRERQERAEREEEERRRETEDRSRAFREASDRIKVVAETLMLIRSEFIEKLHSLGLPRVEEVDLQAAEIVPFAERLALKTIRELAPHVLDLWLAKYAQLLGKTPRQTERFIQGWTSAAFGSLGVQASEGIPEATLGDFSGDPAGVASVDGTGESGSHAAPLEVGSCERPWWRAFYVPPEPYSIKDGPLPGSSSIPRATPPSAPSSARRAGPPPGPTAIPKAGSPPALANERSGVREATKEDIDVARVAAEPLVACVLKRLSSEQIGHFLRGYESERKAKSYLEGELARRMRSPRLEANITTPQESPGEAVRSVVAEIVEDYDKANYDKDDDGITPDFRPDESITPDEKPLECRHGEETPDDKFHYGVVPHPVGTDLEAEIARSHAEDRMAEERLVGEILTPLGELPLPGGGGTYLDRFKRLGEPKSVAVVALRDAGGDVGKALVSLIGKIDESIEEEQARASAVTRTTTATAGGEAPISGSPPEEMSREEFLEFVLERSEDGESIREIVLALKELKHPPTWLRRMMKATLAREVRAAIARNGSDEGSDPDEYDAQAGDDKRSWEMGYEDDPDAEYNTGRLLR